MALQKFIQIQAVFLAGSGITANATSIVTKTFKYPNGNDVVTAHLGAICYATLEPNTEREEIISFTTITQNSDQTATLSGVTRNLNYYHPYTQISTSGYAHAGGSPLVVSNNPQIYENFLSANNTETITGQYTFNSAVIPKVSNATIMPTTNDQLAHKAYIDSVAIAGAPDGTETAKGIYELATSAETISGADTGSTFATLVARPSHIASNTQNNKFLYADDTGIADAYDIALTPVLASYQLGQVIYFKAGNINTGTSTIDVNGLGVKVIKKLNDQDLEAGDIEAGSLVCLVYDGTHFQMQTPQATMPTTAILTEMSDFFGATSMTGAEAESLRDGSNAESLHTHSGSMVASSTTEPKVTNKITDHTPILAQSNAIVSNPLPTSYTKIKEITAGRSGSVIVAFGLGSGGAAGIFGRIYINDVAVGTERTSADTFLESFNISIGNKIQVYAKSSDGGNVGVFEFRIYAQAIEGFVVNL